MPETFTTELPDAETRREMDAAIQPYRKQISGTPALLSLLYDIDLLPKQIRIPVNVGRMIAVCDLFKVIAKQAREAQAALAVDSSPNSTEKP